MGAFGDFFNNAMDYISFRDFLAAAGEGDTVYVTNYLNKHPEALNKTEPMTGSNVLMYAIMKRMPNTVKLLLERGASLGGQDRNGYNALHMAVLSGTKETVDLLLQHPRIDTILNEKNRLNGLTALMYAAMIPDAPVIVQSLLNKGADQTMKDFKERTAFMIAQENGLSNTMKLLQGKRKPIARRKQSKPGRFDL